MIVRERHDYRDLEFTRLASNGLFCQTISPEPNWTNGVR